jgi:uncharacterized iron-regulated protein
MMRAALAAVLAGHLAALLPGDARAQAACPDAAITLSPADQWDATRGGHALLGTVLEGSAPLAARAPADCASAPIEKLRRAVQAHIDTGGIVLLGEMHDNGAQHALRASLLRALVSDLAESRKRKPPALVFEHIRADQAAALETRPAPTAAGAKDLLERLDWKSSGWPAAELFLPIFEVALVHDLPILPGDPARTEVRDVARRGIAALPADTVSRLGLDVPLPDALQNELLDELEASHCGLMPRTAFTNMALAQRYRDAHLAAVLAQAGRTHGSAILLAGNGHVRKDRGVPWYLARLAPELKVLAIMLTEIKEGATDAAAYVERDPDGRPAADFTILTPRTDRPDPCDAMRAHFKKKK